MDAAKPAVLIVDDEEKLCRFLKKEFERAGYPACAAHDGPGALAALAAHPVDVVLLDVVLPGADGVAVLAELKRSRPFLPVVMLTGNATVETAVRALKLGAYDYLTKPYAFSELTALVERAHAESRLRREAARLVLGVGAAPPAPADPSLAALEKAHILKVLAEHGGNRTQAAKALGVDVKTLYNKLKSYQLPA